jgi:hypothetical protein
MGEMEYEYQITGKGTLSEKRIGILRENGIEIKGKKDEVRETVIGKYKYYSDHYNVGWLNTLTYDEPVFKDIKTQKPVK